MTNLLCSNEICELREEISELKARVNDIYQILSEANSDCSFTWDVFISYSHKDEEWVQNWFLPRLESEGLRVCIDFRDFEPGSPSLVEMEKAVLNSRKTLLILTPEYLESAWTGFESIHAQTLDPGARKGIIIPILLRNCQKPLRIKSLTHVDFTRSDRISSQFERLIIAIRKNADYDLVEKTFQVSQKFPYSTF